MMRVLSTKKLQPNQRELLLNAGVSFVEYDAISIAYLDVEIPKVIENAIFTSQNGVKSLLRRPTMLPSLTLASDEGGTTERNAGLGVRCFCVGEKTKALLVKNGYNVVKMALNSVELAQFIAKNHQKDIFHYFCGSRRRDELPSLLKNSEIDVFELETYKTELNLKKFDQKWDGILFFSPSGVESYFEAHLDLQGVADKGGLLVSLNDPYLICIGETTASEAKKYSNKTVIANSTSVESVIAKAVKILNNPPLREA